ncbi:Glucose/Sorbosone dehydrogenase [Cynara cardunculus var. scolymus]|uniref:Glucose/Sorbosone dehydrogenase n=1 Tax=Cynara cardunculus var. scolymus TaxID=59895 RepID=A0A103YC59_CYNCS|nr:Glucose/Sorbosone dehydrogenase [Cynara cardunculus var. scolymus]
MAVSVLHIHVIFIISFTSVLHLLLLLLVTPALSLPLCTDSSIKISPFLSLFFDMNFASGCNDLHLFMAGTPVRPKTPLVFCGYNGSSCCDSIQDSNIQKQFEAMNVSQSDCASLLKSILCSNSPFSPSLRGQAPTPANSSNTLGDIWQSRTDFCNAVGGPSLDGSVCFDGEKVSLNATTNSTITTPTGMCLEKIDNGPYLDMVAHTDGSNRAFFSNQKGQIWLATVPEVGSGRPLDLDESNPFLDLTDEVHFDTQFGLMSIAVHPNFEQNGRFFASFNCDKSQTPSCSGRCACNSDVNCDPSKLPSDSAAEPCQYQSVVAEYTVNGTASSRTSVIPNASPVEVRRIFTMGLPFTSHHAGQILFGPNDGYLYFMMGDGGAGDPYNFAQDKKSLLGKIMRFDVDDIPRSTLYIPEQSPGGNTSASSINPIFPVMGYKHSDISKNEGSASITGGFFYRSTTDPCLYGSYLYGDLYADSMWAGVETPENSGNFTANKIPFTCAKDSPVPCNLVPGTSRPALGYLISFGQDNKNDVYLLSTSGVYRIVPPSRCGYTCAYQNTTTGSTSGPTSTPGSAANMVKGSYNIPLMLLLLFLGFAY